jgi:hypothetical protein
MTIHTPIESPSRVDMKYFVLKMFTLISGLKKPKNNVKIRMLKKSGLGLRPAKNDRF